MSTDQMRPILLVALAFVGFLLWQAWQQDYSPRPAGPASEPAGTSAQRSENGAVPSVATAPGPDVPEVPEPSVTSAAPGGSADAPSTAAGVKAEGIDIRTDLFRARILLKGGTLAAVDLLRYPVSPDEPDRPFSLLAESGAKLFTAQSGLVGKTSAPNHHAVYTSEKGSYALEPGDDEIKARLVWSEGGIKVTKTYTFRRGSYEIGVVHQVENNSSEPWGGRVYGQFRRVAPNESRGLGQIYTYTGGVISSPEKPYEKYDFDDMAEQDLSRDITGGWAAMIQHYFAGAWIPASDVEAHYYSKALPSSQYTFGVVEPGFTVAPGTTGSASLKLFVGPKIQRLLEAAAPGLERTVDYGWLFFIAQPLYIGLQWIQSVVSNWGWSIIFLTVLIKLAFFPLSNASYKSMARMRKLQPKIVSLKDRYGDDRQKLNQAMMEMYKKEKINPLGGCLPIVVQIPVFIALYWVLLETVELRQAPFMFWLNDLSTHDPYYVLPVLMGISMFVQQRLSPAPPDPIQAKVMMAMPIIFTFFFLFFPSGLVLYWLCNNLLSISQQWYITRRIESGAIK